MAADRDGFSLQQRLGGILQTWRLERGLGKDGDVGVGGAYGGGWCLLKQ